MTCDMCHGQATTFGQNIPSVLNSTSIINQRNGEVTLRAKAGLTTKTVVYVNNSNTENSLLNEMDAKRMGIIEVRVEGSSKEVKIHWEKQTKKVYGLLGKDIPNELVADGVSQATSSHLLMFSHFLQMKPFRLVSSRQIRKWT